MSNDLIDDARGFVQRDLREVRNDKAIRRVVESDAGVIESSDESRKKVMKYAVGATLHKHTHTMQTHTKHVHMQTHARDTPNTHPNMFRYKHKHANTQTRTKHVHMQTHAPDMPNTRPNMFKYKHTRKRKRTKHVQKAPDERDDAADRAAALRTRVEPGARHLRPRAERHVV